MHKFITYYHLSLQSKNKTDYIPKDIKNISQLGYKKHPAKKAICRLLSITPHSVEEIAGHFEMSPVLVKGLLVELIEANQVVNVPEHSSKYCLKTKKFDAEVKHE